MSIELQKIPRDIESGLPDPVEKKCGLSSFLCKDAVQYILTFGAAAAFGGAGYTYFKKEYAAAVICTVVGISEIIGYARIGCLKPEGDLDDQILRAKNKIDDLTKQNAKNEKDQASLEATLKKAQDDFQLQVKQNEVLNAERIAHLNKMAELSKSLENTQKQFDEVTTLYNKIKEALKATSQTVNTLDQSSKTSDRVLDKLEKEGNKLSHSGDELDSSVSELENENGKYIKEAKQLDTLIQKLDSQVKALGATLDRIVKEKEALEKAALQVNRIDQAEVKYEQNLKREQDLQAKLEKLTAKLEEKYAEYQKLKKDVYLAKKDKKT